MEFPCYIYTLERKRLSYLESFFKESLSKTIIAPLGKRGKERFIYLDTFFSFLHPLLLALVMSPLAVAALSSRPQHFRPRYLDMCGWVGVTVASRRHYVGFHVAATELDLIRLGVVTSGGGGGGRVAASVDRETAIILKHTSSFLHYRDVHHYHEKQYDHRFHVHCRYETGRALSVSAVGLRQPNIGGRRYSQFTLCRQ